jgi:hypothetical protein
VIAEGFRGLDNQLEVSSFVSSDEITTSSDLPYLHV